MEKKWYIIKSQSNKERSISKKIENEMTNGTLINKVSQVLVPVQNSFYLKKQKKIKREKVMFPGYVFIECSDTSDVRDFLKNLNGAYGFLTSKSGEIQSLSLKEVEKMLGVQEEVNKSVEYVINEKILIIDGPFNTMVGTIDEINENKVKISVPIFNRKTPIELNIDQISKI